MQDGEHYVSRKMFCRLTGSSPTKTSRLVGSGKLREHDSSRRGDVRYTIESVVEYLSGLQEFYSKQRQALGGAGISEDADGEARDAKQMKAVADAWKSTMQLLEQMQTRIPIATAKDEFARMCAELLSQTEQLPALCANEMPKAKQKAMVKRVRDLLAVWRDDARIAIRQAAAESNEARELHYAMLERVAKNKLPETFEGGGNADQ